VFANPDKLGSNLNLDKDPIFVPQSQCAYSLLQAAEQYTTCLASTELKPGGKGKGSGKGKGKKTSAPSQAPTSVTTPAPTPLYCTETWTTSSGFQAPRFGYVTISTDGMSRPAKESTSMSPTVSFTHTFQSASSSLADGEIRRFCATTPYQFTPALCRGTAANSEPVEWIEARVGTALVGIAMLQYHDIH
jgi:hypothetical protein